MDFDSESFGNVCDELIVLSEVLQRQKFRSCFVEHFSSKIRTLIELRSRESVRENDDNLRRLQLKLLEPLILHLSSSANSTEKCLLIGCVMNALNLISIGEVRLFFHLYLLLFSQIFDSDKLNHQVGEELKMIVLECARCLIENSSRKVLEEVFRRESGEKLSLGIFVSVHIARDERSVKLRLEALNFLLVASQFNVKCKYNEGLYKNLGDLFMLYLPGVMAPLQEIVLRNETQHHQITVKALTCWGHILCLVLSDFHTDERPTENEIIKKWIDLCGKSIDQKEVADVEKALREKKRTKNWMTAAAITLKPLILKITEVRKHSNGKCRLELFRVMVKLLENCTVNLKDSLTPIVDVIVGSAVDESEEVCQVAEETFKKFERFYEREKNKTFISVIETNLDSLANKLPGIIHSGNEKLILPSLKSLLGYLRILGRVDKLQQLICYLPTLKKLVFVIQLGFKLRSYPEITNQDFSLWDESRNSKIWSKPWKQFEHFTEESIKIELERICQTLGEHGEPETVVDYLMDIYCRERAQRKEILLILNQTVLGLRKIEDHLADQLLDFYLDSDKFYPVLDVNGEDCMNLKDSHSNIIQVTLILEGVGNLAVKLGASFQNHLLRTLYPVVERMGSSYTLIRTEAMKTAIAISTSCGLMGSIESLIRNNLDYLTFHSTMKLRRNDSGVFDLVNVLIENSTIESMSGLEEIIENVLKTSSRNLNTPLTLSYLRLFQTFTLRVRKWLERPGNADCGREEISDESSVARFIRFVKEREQQQQQQQQWQEEEEDVEESENQEGEEDVEPAPEAPLPRHVAMTVSLSGHCLHFLASKDKNKKLIVLEILNESVSILSEWENQLLPLVHKIWSPLVTRFEGGTAAAAAADPLVTRTSFRLLCTMARTSKHFIRSRTLKNVLPGLRSFLTREASNSKFKSPSSGYGFTQNFKLQRELLEKLADLTVDLELFEKETDSVVESAIPYLSSTQPEELQEKCRQFFDRLKSHDPYLIWFKLQSLIGDREFSRNVEIVLGSLDR